MPMNYYTPSDVEAWSEFLARRLPACLAVFDSVPEHKPR
jgi:hypothetical protein